MTEQKVAAETEVYELLKNALYAFNAIPRTIVNAPLARDTYILASKIDKVLKSNSILTSELTSAELYELLSEALAVIVDDDAVVYVGGLTEPTSKHSSDEFFFLSWEHEGRSYSHSFCFDCSARLNIEGKVILEDADGEEVALQLLSPMSLKMRKEVSHESS